MLKPEQLQVFESVARSHPKFREFLLAELETKSQSLIHLSDVEQLRIAQGYARCLQSLIKNMDDAIKLRQGPNP